MQVEYWGGMRNSGVTAAVTGQKGRLESWMAFLSLLTVVMRSPSSEHTLHMGSVLGTSQTLSHSQHCWSPAGVSGGPSVLT